jgi:PAS domain S-box-containing protein
MSRFSLKTKVAIIFPLSVTLALTLLFFMVHTAFQSYVKSNISRQQFFVLSIIADQIDRDIAARHNVLRVVAKKVTRQMVDHPDEALNYLNHQDEHLEGFNNGLFLFDRQGKLIAELPLGLERSGKDFSSRDYIRQTVASQKPFLSDPYESSKGNRPPAIMFTAPIFDRDGSLMAILGGSIDLTRSAFMDMLSETKLTKGSYIYLYNTDRMLILHPDKNRIMKRDVAPGTNRLFDAAIEGFEGTDETVTSRGLRTLSSFKRLKTKNWIIAANYPATEAYTPIRSMRIAFLFFLPIFSFILFYLMRHYLSRFIGPVDHLTRHVENLNNLKDAERMFPCEGEREIMVLGQAFNKLVHETDQQKLSLETDLERHEQRDLQIHRQNEYLQALHETTLGLLSRHDMSELLQTIVTRAGKLVGTEHCFVYLANEEGTALNMEIQSGIYDSLEHYPILRGQGIAGRVWETGEALHVDDYCSWAGRLPDPGRDALHAMAGVPLKAAGDVIGVLGLSFIQKDITFNQDQMAILAQFGELASLALENAHLVEESRRELTERRNAEERLRKLSVAVEQNPASIVITDIHGTIEYVNPHFTRLTGYSQEEAIGQNPSILKTGETSSAEYQQLWETILAGGEWRGEFHNRKKDGELYWEQAHISPIRDNSYSITHFIAIKEDISERKQLESQLRHSQKMEAIGQLAGGIAHDFNNILTAIIGYSSIIQLKLPDESPLKRSAGQIIETAERGATLTQGLLAFSRKQASNPVLVNLNEVISRIQQLLLRLISEDIRLELTLSVQNLPVLADSSQIEQILMNLATNSRDAMPHGGSITITTESASLDSDFVLARGFGSPGYFAILTFADSGEGMDAETAKHIFEPFYTTKGVGKGTGLGLSIVYGIVKKHNGYITCHSTEAIGTIFQIYFPLLADKPTGNTEHKANNRPFELGNDVILLAEDNETARELAVEILQEFGYTVIVAVDGQQALDLFKENCSVIDLVILDVVMPKLNGSEVYKAIHSLFPVTKVLFYSGYSQEAVISQGRLEHGMNYLAKPYSPKELLMKVREVLDNGN